VEVASAVFKESVVVFLQVLLLMVTVFGKRLGFGVSEERVVGSVWRRSLCGRSSSSGIELVFAPVGFGR